MWASSVLLWQKQLTTGGTALKASPVGGKNGLLFFTQLTSNTTSWVWLLSSRKLLTNWGEARGPPEQLEG